MKLCTFGSRIILFAAILLLSVSAHAGGKYSMTGKAGRSTGTAIDIPGSGNTPCPSLVLGVGTAQTGMLPITPAPSMTGVVANPGGCIPGNAFVTAVGSNPAGFSMPANAFSQALPGMLNVNTVPVSNIVQLATSWSVMGPLAAPLLSPMGSMATAGNQAVWRKFGKSAWQSQTGRAGPTFTWCYGNDACTNVGGGTRPMITKYTGGVNKFGGTMALTLKGGPNPGSVAAVNAAGLPPGAVVMAVLGGTMAVTGSFPAGRGYAAYDFDQLQAGPIYLNYTLTAGGLIGGVGPYIGAFPAATQKNRGFPWTEGTVVVRRTGVDAALNPISETMTAMGNDARSVNGAGNITLVAGSLAFNSFGNNTPSMEVMKLSFANSVPSLSPVGLVGLAAIMLVGALSWFGRGLLKRETN